MPSRKFFFLSYSILLALLVSCSHTRRAPSIEIADVVTVEEQALQEVMATPTDFTLALSDDRAALQRAHLFFERFAPEKLPLEKKVVQRSGVDMRAARGERYSYLIERQFLPHDGAMKYQIRCVARNAAGGIGSEMQADRNARALARFIKDGALEVSLVER